MKCYAPSARFTNGFVCCEKSSSSLRAKSTVNTVVFNGASKHVYLRGCQVATVSNPNLKNPFSSIIISTPQLAVMVDVTGMKPHMDGMGKNGAVKI